MSESQSVAPNDPKVQPSEPDHLFLGDRSLNMQDMAAKGRAAGQRKTHCVNGHEFTPENTLLNVGKRCCRECRRLQAAAGYARRGNGRG